MKRKTIFLIFSMAIFWLFSLNAIGQKMNDTITEDTIILDGHQFIKNITKTEDEDAHYENWVALEKGVADKLRKKMMGLKEKATSSKQQSNECLEWILDYYAVNATETVQFQAHLDQHIDGLTQALNNLFGKTNTGQAVNWTINPLVTNLNLANYPGSFGQATDQVILYMLNNDIDPDVHFGVVFSPEVNAGTSGGAAPQGGATVLGETWRIGAWKDINRLLVAFHEIGHSLNLVHTNGSGCIMEGSAVRDTCFAESSIGIFNTTVINHWGDFSEGSCASTSMDNCPNDPNKTEPDDCGCGTPETDCNEVDCSINLQTIAMIEEDSLVKGRNIEANNEIANGLNVFFKAGESITLKNGFHAIAGSVFTAKIGTCIESTNSLVNHKIINRQFTQLPISSEISLKVYPNPFQSQTTVRYHLPQSGTINLQLIDFLGRKVSTLANHQQKDKGWHQLQLNAATIPPGTYYLLLTNKEQLKTSKLVVLR